MDWTALLGGERPPTSIVRWSSGAAPLGMVLMAGYGGEKVTLSGALTANTLKTMLNISGAGVLKACAVQALNATSRTLRLKITIDGVAAFDPGASAANTASNAAIIGVGGTMPYNSSPIFVIAFERIPFNTSCLVEIASSLSETDNLALLYAYELR